MALSIPYKQKRALIIGINNYPREPLKYCINDAADLKIALEDIDFKVSYIVDCNRDKFYHKIDSFADKIQSDDLVLFYFAGHGKQNENENYLLPSNYNYDYRGHERDYIGERAINVKYIMNQLDHRNARVTIYLFDCCRNLVRIRGTDANQGLLPATAASQSLIVYACAPGKAALDETQNNKNGIFMGNLLKYIKMSNKDIEEITEMVTNDVCSQTGGFQRPHRINSLTGKVFLVTNNDAGCMFSF
jgi:uncharacterized caspase-like protein